jgi:hypothetical protein
MAVRRAARPNRTALRLESLEGRDVPAGLATVGVSPAGVLTLAAVPGRDGDEVLSVARRADGAYLVTPAPGTALRVGKSDVTTPLPVFGVTAGLAADLGAGNDQLSLDGAAFAGSVAVRLGAGNNTLNVFDTTVGGGLSVTAGGGFDTVFFAGTGVAVGGAFTAALGDGTNLVRTDLARATFGAFRVAGGAGNDVLRATGNDLALSVAAGGLTFAGGGGANTVALGDGAAKVAVAGRVAISGAGSGNTVTVGGTRFDAGSLSLAFGGGTNSLTADPAEFHLAGSLSWASGAGDDALLLRAADARIGGAVVVSVGDGPVEVRVSPTDFLAVGRGVTVRAGVTSGRNFLFVGAVSDTVIGGAVAVSAGAGNAFIDVFSSASLVVGGSVTVTHGPGAGSTRVACTGRLEVPGSIAVTQAGAQGPIVTGAGGPATIGGSVTLVGGSSQSLGMSGVVRGGVTMIGAAGAPASMFLGTIGSDPPRVHGPIRLVSRTAAGQPADIVLRTVIAEGPIAVLGGAGAEALSIDDSAFVGSFGAALGAGDDQFRVELGGAPGFTTFFGPAVLRGGAGADTFLLGGDDATRAVGFRGATTTDGGPGTDSLTAGSFTAFDPAHPLAQKNFP